jgi:hypothetical protein
MISFTLEIAFAVKLIGFKSVTGVVVVIGVVVVVAIHLSFEIFPIISNGSTARCERQHILDAIEHRRSQNETGGSAAVPSRPKNYLNRKCYCAGGLRK